MMKNVEEDDAAEGRVRIVERINIFLSVQPRIGENITGDGFGQNRFYIPDTGATFEHGCRRNSVESVGDLFIKVLILLLKKGLSLPVAEVFVDFRIVLINGGCGCVGRLHDSR